MPGMYIGEATSCADYHLNKMLSRQKFQAVVAPSLVHVNAVKRGRSSASGNAPTPKPNRISETRPM